MNQAAGGDLWKPHDTDVVIGIPRSSTLTIPQLLGKPELIINRDFEHNKSQFLHQCLMYSIPILSHPISKRNLGNLRFLLKRSPKKPSPALPRFSAAAALCPQLRAGGGTQRLELTRGPAQATAVEVEPGGKKH